MTFPLPRNITATDHHPFWIESAHSWLEAASLRPGMLLRASGGVTVTVDEVSAYRDEQDTYNLTVEGVHTYYVVVGATSVLVHNSKSCPPGSGPFPAPRDLDAFPEARRAKPKTPVQGGGGLRKRWVDQKGNIYEWDSQHRTVEMYNKRGRHLGEYDPISGEQTKPANPSRKVAP